MTCAHVDTKPISSACDWCRQCGAIRFRAQGTWYSPGGKEGAEDSQSAGGSGLTEPPVLQLREPGPANAFDPDECCGKHLAKALRDGELEKASEWRCPKCGALWQPLEGNVLRHWSPVPEVAVFHGRN